MLKLAFLLLFVLGSIQASPDGAAPQTKTYTLPDGTVVHETIVKEGNKTIVKKQLVRKVSATESVQINQSLGKMPHTTIKKVDGGSDIANIPAQQLLIFLNQQGITIPSDLSKVPGLGSDPNAIINIYLDQLYELIANKDQFSKAPAQRIISLLRQNPSGKGGNININVNGGGKGGAGGNGGGVKVTGGNGIEDGKSYLANTGINRRQKCDRGLIDETATGIKEGVNGAVGSLADALGSGVIGAVGHGASALITHAISGVDFAIQDAACGLGNIANEIASAVDNGDIIGGVGKIGQEFFGGIANMAEDLASEAGAGVGQAANDIFGFLQDVGK